MKILLLTFSMLMSVQVGLAKDLGGSDRGGGDAKVIRSLIMQTKREKLIKAVVNAFSDQPNNLGTSVRGSLSWLATGRQKFSDEKAEIILKDMIAKGFGRDLAKTKFVMSERCVDRFNIERTAVATMNVPASDICINPARLVDEFGPYIQDSDIMGLMIHEFAHHYGYEDTDHFLASSVAMDYQLDNEDRNQDGAPLNYLIK